VRGLVAVAPGLAERGDRAVDELRRARGDLRIAHAEPVHHAWPEAFDQDVGALGEPQQELLPLGMLEVEPQALLPAMGVAEPHRVAGLAQAEIAHRLAALVRLDLDHLGAVVGHHHRQMRPRQEEREVEDLDAFELHRFDRFRRHCA
jgi:hypothetical protein